MKKVWSWILIDEIKRVLLIKRKYTKKNKPNFWSFPGWWNENNETIEETAIREVKEEVWLDFYPTELFDEHISWDYHLFKYLWKYSWKIIVQEEECDWYWWFSYEEVKKLLISEHMNDLIEKLHERALI
jgi:8-oxo-dGTP pyrophosphatase MutT (NUDIX family)